MTDIEPPPIDAGFDSAKYLEFDRHPARPFAAARTKPSLA
jgi:hypothetical protein